MSLDIQGVIYSAGIISIGNDAGGFSDSELAKSKRSRESKRSQSTQREEYSDVRSGLAHEPCGLQWVGPGIASTAHYSPGSKAVLLRSM